MSGFRISSLKDGKYFAIEDDWEDEYRGESGRFFYSKGRRCLYGASRKASNDYIRICITIFSRRNIKSRRLSCFFKNKSYEKFRILRR